MINKRVRRILAVFVGGVLASCGGAVSKDTSGVIFGLSAVDASIDRDQPFLLRVTLQNNTTESLRFLPWGTPFESELSADCFEVVYNGQRLAYVGRMIKRIAPQESDYVVLTANESLEVLVDLTRAYAVDVPGDYRVKINPVIDFEHTDLVQPPAVSIKRKR